MRKSFTLLSAVVLIAGCGDIGLHLKDGKDSPSLLQAAKQLGLDGYWQFSEGGTGWIVQVGTDQTSYGGQSYQTVLAGGEGIFSHATMQGLRVYGTEAQGPRIEFLLLDAGSPGVTSCTSDGCQNVQDPTPPFQKLETQAITAVREATLTIQGKQAGDTRTMVHLANPPAQHDALTLDMVTRDLSGLWQFVDSSSGKSWLVVLGTRQMTYDGYSYFEVLAGGQGFDGSSEMVGIAIDRLEGTPRLRLLSKQNGELHSDSVGVLQIFDDYVSLGDQSTETGRMIRP